MSISPQPHVERALITAMPQHLTLGVHSSRGIAQEDALSLKTGATSKALVLTLQVLNSKNPLLAFRSELAFWAFPLHLEPLCILAFPLLPSFITSHRKAVEGQLPPFSC